MSMTSQIDPQDRDPQDPSQQHQKESEQKQHEGGTGQTTEGERRTEGGAPEEGRPIARPMGRPATRAGEGISPEEAQRGRLRGTAAMDPQTRKEVARKGGLAVSRNRQHMAEIGRKGGQSVSKNRDHMAAIGRKGGAASRGHRG